MCLNHAFVGRGTELEQLQTAYERVVSTGKPHLVSQFGRQALHAYRLGLVHPSSRKDCEWQAPLPEDFAGLLARAGIPLTTTGA